MQLQLLYALPIERRVSIISAAALPLILKMAVNSAILNPALNIALQVYERLVNSLEALGAAAVHVVVRSGLLLSTMVEDGRLPELDLLDGHLEVVDGDVHEDLRGWRRRATPGFGLLFILFHQSKIENIIDNFSLIVNWERNSFKTILSA